MGIYISGVKGLPEQVQENKEDIKTIKEEIEGIDFEEIRQLEEQVGENTQDINNLEASIGVQNQAINRIDDKATALERTTQLMSYNDDLSMTDFRNSIEVADDVYARNVRVEGDGSIVNTTQSGMHFKEGANDDTLTIANNDGATPHYLHFNANGTLDIDGNPVGASDKYVHTFTCRIQAHGNFGFQIVSDRATAYTLSDLYQWFVANGFTSFNDSPFSLGIFVYKNSNEIFQYKMIRAYNNNLVVSHINLVNGASSTSSITSLEYDGFYKI